MADDPVQATTDLRPWGWAPGGYLIRCLDCAPDVPPFGFNWPSGAKRAWRCEPCARKAMEADNAE